MVGRPLQRHHHASVITHRLNVDHVARVDTGRRRLVSATASPSPAVDAHRIITTDDDNSDSITTTDIARRSLRRSIPCRLTDR
jgi:hypothetical protein